MLEKIYFELLKLKMTTNKYNELQENIKKNNKFYKKYIKKNRKERVTWQN